ncbi:hypothetical protein DPMN_162665 [Dreissena polymorpha]|uniref:Uncharacterized protein n=1 Tax=Dreissena polymorpha TaxID=45954 RepID=A0A9D4IQR8_DREPO|nr:hypothetical protein DPMN_162665 [Dreissena polymorpha]
MQATNMVLIIFHHGDKTINVTKSVDMKNAPPPGHAFKPTGTIFILARYIIGTHCFTKFHEDGTISVASRPYFHIKKNAPPPGANIFQPTGTNFELAQGIIGPYLLTKFHDDGQYTGTIF